jgi:hypothetical protein
MFPEHIHEFAIFAFQDALKDPDVLFVRAFQIEEAYETQEHHKNTTRTLQEH